MVVTNKPEIIIKALQKFWEGDFFCVLMSRIEHTQKELVNYDRAGEFELQFTYLISAFLNACYSATEYLKRDKRFVSLVSEFRKQHKNIYGSGPFGGWRTKSVHFAPVSPGFIGGPPPISEEFFKAIEEFAPNAIKPVDWDTLNPDVRQAILEYKRKQVFYFDDSHDDSILNMCQQHLLDVGGLIGKCESRITGQVADIDNESKLFAVITKHFD